MTVTRRVWRLAKGDEIRGVEARELEPLGGTLRRHALVVDPPFVATKAGWHACTMDSDSGLVMISPCGAPGPGDEVGAFSGGEEMARHLAPTPEEAEAIAARAERAEMIAQLYPEAEAEDQARAEESG